jgi:HK97 family phage prohead protease
MKKVHYIVKRQEQTADAGPSKVSFVASTATPDRYGDIIDQKGWSLDAYNNNPIVLLNHDSSQLPIGRGQVEIKNDQLVIDVEFDMDDPRAAEVARKTQKGFMNAVSVGFQPLQSALRAELPKDNPYYGKSGQFHEIRNMIRSELLTLPEMRIKHILEISEEDDKIVISFAKADREMEEMEEEALDRRKEEDEDEEKKKDDDEEESTEDMPKSYHDDDEDSEDDDKRKNFETDIDKIAELFAQII